jgi:hypothetical protein
MSEERRLNLGAVDLDLMQSAAEGLGYTTVRESGHLQIKGNGLYRSIRFKTNAETNDTELSVDSDNMRQYAKVLEGYTEQCVARKGRGRFSVFNRAETDKEIVITLRRRG